MTIKQHGGIFGRNPKFNDVEVESLTIAGNAVPDASTILVDGDIGTTVQGYDADTAKYDDATANFTGTLQNGGSNVLVDTDIGSTVQGYDADTAKYDDTTANFTGTLQNGGSNVLVDTDIGSTVQGYDADTAKYDDTTANFTGTLQNGGSNVLVDTDIGSTVQGYDADTAKLDTAQTFTAAQTFNENIVMANTKGIDFSATGDGSGTSSNELLADYEEGTWTPVYDTTGTTFDAITHSIQDGFYRKVGNLVVVNFFLRTSSVTVGSATGIVTVTGLPYTPANTRNPGGTVVTSFGWGVNAPRTIRASSTGELFLAYLSAANRTADISPSDMGAATNNDCYATCIYYT